MQATKDSNTAIEEFKEKYNNVEEETFFLSEGAVTIKNPIYFMDSSSMVDHDKLVEFLIENQRNYDQLFRKLADMSRIAYMKEKAEPTGIQQQLEVVNQYISNYSAKVISDQTGISYTTCLELKKAKRKLENSKVSIFSKLYNTAIKEKNQNEK